MKKILIMDASFYVPIKETIVAHRMVETSMSTFLDRTNSKLLITNTAWSSSEFSHSLTPNFDNLSIKNTDDTKTWQNSENDKINGLNIKQVFFSNNGTIVNTTFTEPSISLSLVDDNKLNSKTLWAGTNHWQSLSGPDRSAINLANFLINDKFQVIILANEKHLREQACIENIPVLGTSGFLSWLVMLKIINPQKATHIYSWWKSQDFSWIVPKMSFAEISELFKAKEYSWTH